MRIGYILVFFIVILVVLFVIELVVDRSNRDNFNSKFPPNILAKINNKLNLPKIEHDGTINKTIYRTYYDKNLLNLFEQASIVTQKNMPDYKQVVYDDDDIETFIKEKYGDRIYNAYKHINPEYGPAKADFFRYLIIYYYGGVYLDIKSCINKDIRKIIQTNKDRLLTSKGRSGKKSLIFRDFGTVSTNYNKYDWSYFSGIKYGEYNNWHIIAPKGHPILGQVIKQIVSNIEWGLDNKQYYSNGEYSVLVLTGPIMYTKVIEKYKNDNNIKIFEPNLDKTVLYKLDNHKNKGTKKHYSKVENKVILV